MSGAEAFDGRRVDLERHGRAYGELRLAIAFTDGLEGEAAKRVSARGWDKTGRLASAEFGASYLAGRGERRNPAVVLRPSGLVGIDIDGPSGVDHLRRIVPERLPRTITVTTGKESGFHLWYAAPEGARSAFVELGPDGITPKANQYLVAPPAVHPSGRVYRFADGRAPWEIELTELPLDLLERLERAGGNERRQRAASTGPIASGHRHDHLMRLGSAMRRHGACLEAVTAALLTENSHRCQPPKDEQTIVALAADLTHRYGPGQA